MNARTTDSQLTSATTVDPPPPPPPVSSRRHRAADRAEQSARINSTVHVNRYRRNAENVTDPARWREPKRRFVSLSLSLSLTCYVLCAAASLPRPAALPGRFRGPSRPREMTDAPSVHLISERLSGSKKHRFGMPQRSSPNRIINPARISRCAACVRMKLLNLRRVGPRISSPDKKPTIPCLRCRFDPNPAGEHALATRRPEMPILPSPLISVPRRERRSTCRRNTLARARADESISAFESLSASANKRYPAGRSQ